MEDMNPESLLSTLNWRYAVKKFDPSRKIEPNLWSALEQSLVLSPSSYGLQLWNFLVVENPNLREQLRTVSWNQSQVTDASHYVVITARESVTPGDVDRHLRRVAEVRGIPLESLGGYRAGVMGDVVEGPRSAIAASWAQRQTYIAMGFLMLAAAEMRIDTCPMEGLDPARYDEILGLKGSPYRTVAAVALGYRHPEDKYASAKKVRFPAMEMIRHLR
jgi:nitroreductase